MSRLKIVSLYGTLALKQLILEQFARSITRVENFNESRLPVKLWDSREGPQVLRVIVGVFGVWETDYPQ